MCRELRLSGSAVRARMALVLLDAIADSLIYRRLQDLYSTSEEPLAPDGPAPTRERNDARHG